MLPFAACGTNSGHGNHSTYRSDVFGGHCDALVVRRTDLVKPWKISIRAYERETHR